MYNRDSDSCMKIKMPERNFSMSFKMKRTIEMRRVESAFADYLENEGSVDLLWSDKVGYVFLTINE